MIFENKFFNEIQKDELAGIDVGLFKEKSAKAGEVIINEGTPGDVIFLLLEGEVGIHKKFSDGKEHELGRIGAGDFFGEMAIIERRERSATVRCLTPCRLAGIHKEDFFPVVKVFPRLINNIANVMANRLRESDTKRTKMTEKNRQLKRLNEEISEKKKELELLNQTKDRFFTIISHDLKTPVTTIGGLSTLLSETAGTITPDKIRECTEMISEASFELSKLLDNLLEWAKVQTGKLRYEPEEVNLSELTAESIQMLITDAKAKKIGLKTEIDDRITACLDKNMMAAVIRNITSNAIKFTRPGGKVTVKAKENGKTLELSVHDTGVGISKDNMDRLFKIDGHLSLAGTEGETGSGLGLILSKEFIDIHGGEIGVESEVEKGTTFRIMLPKSPD